MTAAAIAARVGTPARSRTRGRRPGAAVITVVLWMYAAIAVLPLLTMVGNSFRTYIDIATNPWPIPVNPTVENYVNAWTRASFATYMFNSVVVTASALALSTLVAVPAAYAIARWTFRGRALVESLFMSGLLIPFMLAILPMFYLMDWLHLVDSPISLVLIYAANGIPFTTFILVSFFRQLPEELNEAALLDGASHVTAFFHVMLPLVRPAFISSLSYTFVRSMTAVSAVIFLISARWYHLTVLIYNFSESLRFGLASVLALTLIVIVFATFGIMRLLIRKNVYLEKTVS